MGGDAALCAHLRGEVPLAAPRARRIRPALVLATAYRPPGALGGGGALRVRSALDY